MLQRAEQLEQLHAGLVGDARTHQETELLPGNRVAAYAYIAVDDCHGQDGFRWADATAVLRDWYGFDLDQGLHLKVKTCASERDRLIAQEVEDRIKRAGKRR